MMLVTLLGCAMLASAQMRVPRDGKITLVDHGYRDWDAEVLHYRADPAAFPAGKVVLKDAAGTEVPSQIDDGILSFVAALPKGGSATYTLAPGTPDPALSSLRVSTEGDQLVLANAWLAVRVPKPAERTLAAPVAAAGVPAPLQGWRHGDSPWMGGSRLLTDRQVSAYRFALVKRGPVCVEYEARYQFVPKGEYVCRIVVSHGLPRAEVIEEFDFGSITPGQDFLLLEVQKGMAAATFGIAGGSIQRAPLAQYLAPKLKDGTNPPAPVGGDGATPLPPLPEPGMVLLEKIGPAVRFGGLIGGVELRGAAENDQLPDARVAVVPLHAGNWRRAMVLTVWHHPRSGVVVALPISVRPVTWYAETTDDISPFSTHEHDSGLAPSYGRRQWALDFSAHPESLQERVGYIGLDTYKEWVLDWPEKTPATAYPRAWYTKADIARLKPLLAQHPDGEMLAGYYVFSGKTEHAVAQAQAAITGTFSSMSYLGNWYVSGWSHYRQSQMFGGCAQAADSALACPDLPADVRRDLRRTLAFMAYLLSNPDFNPRGAGVHLGNNNMSINRTCALAYYASLLPDHPQYQYWMDSVTDFVRMKLGTHFAVDGANLECPTYQLYGPARFLDDATTIIRNTGGPDLAAYLALNVAYLANLTMPDPRIDGRRFIPGMGNSANMLESYFGISLRTVERADPALAARMLSIHTLCWPTEPLNGLSGNHAGQVLRYLPDITAKPADLTTTVIPTYGVVFRAHFNTPNETAMLFRAGINWGHWDGDPLNTILYGKGAPLSPGTGYQYYGGAGNEKNTIYHNQVKVGAYHQREIEGRVDSALADYGCGPHADYAMASRYYPPEVFKDGRGAMAWNRQILFLKSPNPDGATYFVMRDTFPGGEGRPTWWTWMNLDGAELISVDGKGFDPAQVPQNKLVPEAQMPTITGNHLEMKTHYGAGTHFWFAGEPLPIRIRMTWTYWQGGRLGLNGDQFPKLATNEQKTTVEAMAEPGAEYFYLVYPHKNTEAVPRVATLAEGAMKVITPDATDYVFVSETPLAIEQEGVVFTGKAGAVRIFPDHVVFCMTSGNGRIGYKGCIFEGAGPFERTVKIADLRAGVTAVRDTDVKAEQRADLGEQVIVRGEGPFTAQLDGQTLRIATDGRARVLYINKPAWMWRPQYRIDGQEWMACWTDYPSSGWGTYANTHLIAVAVPAGKHVLTLTDQVFVPVWTRQFTPTIAATVR